MPEGEAGHDYNEEYGDYGDYGNGFDAFGNDDTFGDDTYDGDTYDEENGEEIDVESMFIDEGDPKYVEAFEEMPKDVKDSTIKKVNEAAHNDEVGKNRDYSNNLLNLKYFLIEYKLVIKAIIELMGKKAYERHKVKILY